MMAEKSVGVVGEVVLRPLDLVRPNSWNPNRMTPEMESSLRVGLETDGWLASQALLIWGTDEGGARQDLIIDGEHRWKVAKSLGMIEGPMVFLDALSPAGARALTIKLNQKRGSFDFDALGDLLRGIEMDLADMGIDDLALELGFRDDELMKLLAEPPEEPTPTSTVTAPVPIESSTEALPDVWVVQLFFNAGQHEEFLQMLVDLKGRFGVEGGTSEVVFEAMKIAVGSDDA